MAQAIRRTEFNHSKVNCRALKFMQTCQQVRLLLTTQLQHHNRQHFLHLHCMNILLIPSIARYLLHFPSLTKRYLNHLVGLIRCLHHHRSHLISLHLYLHFQTPLDLHLTTGPSIRVSLLRIDIPHKFTTSWTIINLEDVSFTYYFHFLGNQHVRQFLLDFPRSDSYSVIFSFPCILITSNYNSLTIGRFRTDQLYNLRFYNTAS